MSAMTNILVKDDATSPVEVTLVPVTDNPIPYWRGNTSGVPLEGQVRLYMSTEQVKSGAWKVTAKLEVPVMETLGASGTSAGYVAPPKVAYVDTGIFTLFVDKRSTEADRYNLLKMMAGIVQGSSATTATGILDNESAGDAWKTSTKPGPLFFGQLIVPN
jgi:hypothetical protein